MGGEGRRKGEGKRRERKRREDARRSKLERPGKGMGCKGRGEEMEQESR